MSLKDTAVARLSSISQHLKSGIATMMDDPVKGQYALITGGGSGISLSFVKLLLSKGCSVIIADLSLRPEAQALLEQYPAASSSPACHFFKTNVVSWKQLSALWSFALTTFPQIDIVVCGAGVFEPRFSAFWEAPRSSTNPDSPSGDAAEVEVGHYAQMDINLTAPMRLSQLAIGHWTREKQKGCLIHLGSIAGYATTVGSPMYHASKFGLLGFVRSLSTLRDEVGIRVSYCAPCQVKTPMWAEDAHKAALMTEDMELVEPEVISDAMYELVVKPELGDGTVYEVTGTGRRVVPQWNYSPPSGYGLASQGYAGENQRVLDLLKNKGLQT